MGYMNEDRLLFVHQSNTQAATTAYINERKVAE